jgi:general L-amino acid transport system permease protein
MAVQDARSAAPTRVAPWNNPTIRALFYQLLLIAVVVLVAAYLVHNTLVNLDRQGIATGFGFLDREAAFEIAEPPIDYSPADTYGRAFLVGLSKTLIIAGLGIVLATILGTLIGVARLSTNWLIRKLTLVYVESIRNVPLLLQLFIWWDVLRLSAPGPREAWQPIPDIFVSNRGVIFPIPFYHTVHLWMFGALLVGIAATVAVSKWAAARQAATGQQFPTFSAGLGLILGLPILTWLAGGAPLDWDVPQLKGFNFAGGQVISPEFAALLIGLVVYTAAFIAEIVRGGILGVSWGQTEAASSLGLKRGHALSLVVLPQALRIIVPPMTSQYLNITKNSSLAVAIGVQEVTSIGNTTINQTGQAVEGIALIMVVYLTFSLGISFCMNIYNRAVALVER